MDGKKRGSNILIMLEALGLALVLVLSILTSVFAGVKKASGKENTKQEQPTENAVTEDVSYDIFTEGAVVFDDEIEEKIASMTTEEKVAQMFLVSPEDFTGNDEVTVAGEGCKGAIETYPVGGMVVSRANFLDKDVTADNLSNLQAYSSDRIGCELLLVVEQGAEGNEAVSAVDYMKQEPFIDVEKIGAVGASYGGFSIYWLAGHHEHRFAALLAHAGIFNTESQYLETEEMWFANWDLGGAFWDKENAVAQRSFANSPHKFVDKWDTPIMVTVGEKDYRILASQGMMAFNAARLRGIPCRMLVFPDENHWILKPQNAVLWQREFFKWFDQWLKGSQHEAE